MPYALTEIELSRPLCDVQLAPDQDGCGVVLRWNDAIVGFVMRPAPRGARIPVSLLREWIGAGVAQRILSRGYADAFEKRWPTPAPAPAPRLSIAICTRDRAERLARLLGSLRDIRAASPFASTEIVVVDNASPTRGTRDAVARFDDVRYVLEPRTGLDFARNAALHASTGDLLAYLDDDVVVDRGWLHGLHRAWTHAPNAGGYAGLVLPFRLDTEARVRFEAQDGFGRGFEALDYRIARFGNPTFPLGTGIVGTGCNMAFDRALLLSLQGFDEALDTGAPLPGGGDLDIFLRVLLSGRGIVYEPAYAVYHEHRETLEQLQRQYWTWGLGLMAYLVKAWRHYPGMRGRRPAMLTWWFLNLFAGIAGSLRRRDFTRAGFRFAELRGGLQGLCGEYDRSIRRSRRIRESQG